MDNGELAALEQLCGTPGVLGAWLAQASGGLVRTAGVPGYGPGELAPVAAAAHRILSGAGAGILELELEGGRLRAELVEDWVLVVLTGPGADRAWVRMSCEVARPSLREARRTRPRSA